MQLKRSVLFGLGLGVGCCLLRLTKADSPQDYIFAGGLTLIECATVAGLDWFADRHRAISSSYRATKGQIDAVERGIASVDAQIRDERARYAELLEELKRREAECFDVERLVEDAPWVVEAAYRRAINANQRLLEGGGGLVAPEA